MLRFSATYKDRPILSLRTGGVIGHAISPLINPHTLKIEGWFATESGSKEQMILPYIEVREVIPRGIAVNDHDSITDPDDLIRLKETIDVAYELIGKNVKTESGKKLGKVNDYAVDDSTMLIQKIYVTQSILRSISTQQLIIDRNQVVETTDKYIIVKDAFSRQKAGETVAAPAA